MIRRAGFHGHAAALIFTLVAALAFVRPATAETQSTGYLQPPPMVNGQPVEVGIGLRIINIAAIDEVKEQFEIDGYLMARWKDPHLAFTPAGPGDDERDYAAGQVWIPYFEMVNGVAPHERYDMSIRGSADGSMNYIERFHAVLSSKFRLRRFPFDSQSLLIIIHPFVRQVRQVRFRLLDHDVWALNEFNQYSSLAQWDLQAVEPMIDMSRLYGNLATPEARFTIKVTRRSNFYLWKVFLPLSLMVVLSWSVFWVEAADLSNQVQIAVTTILTVIAFAFAISATMPRVPYLTYIDGFFLTCYVFVFLAIVELMSVHLAYRRKRVTDLGIRIQHVSRWLVPAAFLITNVILIAHFLG